MKRNITVCKQCKYYTKTTKQDMIKRYSSETKPMTDFFSENEFLYECHFCWLLENVELIIPNECKYKFEHEVLK